MARTCAPGDPPRIERRNFALLKYAQIPGVTSKFTISSLEGFGPSGTLRGSRLLLMGAVCGLIVPCMAGLALSQKLRRWPVGEANFRIW